MSTLQEIQNRFMSEIAYVDDLSQIILKGHLVIEEIMTEAITRFVFHSEIAKEAKLQFHQKLTICRAISVREENNPMWELVAKINSLRNHLSHSLNDHERTKRINSLRSCYEQNFGTKALNEIEEMNQGSAMCMLAISGCIGFLHSFLSEIKSFEALIETFRASP
jgi:hypothetical protein